MEPTQSKVEFKVGDRLTFKPYRRAYGVKVLSVHPNRFGDGRVIYAVAGMAARSLTSGQCLVESELFTENH